MSRQLLQHLLLSCLSLSLLPTCQAAATAPAVHTQATNGGVTRLGQRVTVQCRPLRPTDIVLVRLLRRPLTGGAEVEVFVSASGSRGALRPPWKSRRDATFSVKTASLSFNMTTADEGSYKCLALTLDGPSAGGRVQLLTAMTPAEPRLFVNGKQTLPMASKKSSAKRRIELVEGQAIMIRCNANVGKPPGSLSLLDLSRRAHLKGAVRTWTGPVTAGSKTMTVYSSVTHSVKIELGSHGAVYGCQLKPHPMFAHLNITYGVKSDPIRVLYTVRRIELQPYRDNYFHGDRIDCLAKGRPAPKIQWTRIRGAGPLQVNGSSLYLQPGAKVGYYAYTCSASNRVRGHYHRLLQSIGFHLHNRTIAAARTTAAPQPPAVGGPGVPTKVKHWVRSHHRGISVFLITFGVICGFALIAVVFAYLYSTAFSSSTAYGRLRENPEDRLRFYGDNGRGNGGAYCDTSDEEEGSVSQPLNKAKDTSWIGTPL
ncbi:hypothetical protein BOX15_Mlig007081g1 [Macrostomum lignano]|uniref:Ig-like domain-containing protein n=1 Tax=Macrostomum lignano TaxID=282301 RepID=A0A267EK00_9PLAT|nr:hypothetical protein BOX15_Mlig007081g1 [Macrostomum lignano]